MSHHQLARRDGSAAAESIRQTVRQVTMRFNRLARKKEAHLVEQPLTSGGPFPKKHLFLTLPAAVPAFGAALATPSILLSRHPPLL